MELLQPHGIYCVNITTKAHQTWRKNKKDDHQACRQTWQEAFWLWVQEPLSGPFFHGLFAGDVPEGEGSINKRSPVN